MQIAVTKLKEKSEGIHELFHSFGHEALIISTMKASIPSDNEPLLRLCNMALKGEIDILIFTSSLGVDKFFEITHPKKNIRIVSVGPKTAKKVEKYGLSSEIIDSFSSEHFSEYLGDIKDKKIGIARAEVPNPELINSLISKGALVFEASAYSLCSTGCDIIEQLKNAQAIIFTSSGSFRYSGFDKEKAKNLKLKLIAIGEKTASEMRNCGITPDIVGNGTLEDCLKMFNKLDT